MKAALQHRDGWVGCVESRKDLQELPGTQKASCLVRRLQGFIVS